MQPVIEQWLDRQKAPESVIASKIANGKVERPRPLCPYPEAAVWKGTGSIDDAANFVWK